MRISAETRIATVRYCASKIPLLFLLLLLSPSTTTPRSESAKASVGTEAVGAAPKVPFRPQRAIPGLAQPRSPPHITQARHSNVDQAAGLRAPAASEQKEAVSPADDLKEWFAVQEDGRNGHGLAVQIEESKGYRSPVQRQASDVSGDSGAPPQSAESPDEPSLTPLRYTLLAFLVIWLGIRPAIFTLDESLTHFLLANPLPAVSSRHDESDGRLGCGRVGTWSPRRWTKVLAGLRWRVRSVVTRGGKAAFALASLTIVLAGVLASDPIVSGRVAPSEVGWNAVAGRWLFARPLRLAPGPAETLAGARGWMPLRNLIWLETFSAFACALHGLSPLLLHLGILRPTLSAKFLLSLTSASPSPSDGTSSPFPYVPTAHLISTLYLPLLTRFVTLLQALQLLLARSPTDHCWFSLSTMALFLAITVPLDSMVVVRQRAAREAERLVEVAATFGDEANAAEGCSDADEHNWVCSVCLRDSFDFSRRRRSAGSSETAERVVTFDSRCRLPCGHRFHAYCLSTWFASLSACPTCHQAVTRPPAHSSSPTPAAPAPAATSSVPFFADDAAAAEQAQQAAAAEAQLNQYPGAAALRRRETERQRTVTLPAEMSEDRERELEAAIPSSHV